MAKSLYDTTLISSSLLEMYQSQGLTDTQIALRIADDKITARILATNGEYTKQKLNSIQALIQLEITKAYGGLFETIGEESVAVAQVNFNAILGATSAVALPKSAVAELINSNRKIQDYNFKDLFNLTSDTHARQLKIVIASGMNNSQTASQIVKDYKIRSRKLTNGQVVSNVFTVISDARNQGNYVGYAELEKEGVIKYYEHNSTLDASTSSICIRYDGRRYFKSIEDIKPQNKPPLHFNCRSQLVARTTFNRQDRNSKDGVIVSERYPTWFKKQDSQFQKKVLGTKKYELYKKGSYRLRSLPDALGNRKIDLANYESSLKKFIQ